MKLPTFVLFAACSSTAYAQEVVGGDPSAAGEWPDAAAILDSSGTVFCSGTLITDSLVLSAGHCSGRAETIVLDSHNLSQNLGITRNIRRTWQYPDYLNTLDIAVFELDEAVSIAPRALAVTCLADNYLADNASVQIVGFGATDVDGTDFPQALMQASTLVLDATCTTPERDCNASVYPWGELIAGGGGVDSCVGDSGGPLYIPTPHGTFLAGVTSRGIKPATTSCGEGGIYVRAEAAVDWIETETKSMLPKPDCMSLGLNQRPQPTDQRLDVTESVTTVQIHPNDPDEGQSHQFYIETAPTMGSASVDDAGWMTYTTSQITPFTDSVVIRVTDDGTPPLYSDVTLTFSFSEPRFEDPGGFACASVPNPVGFYGLWLGIAGLLCHHRRRIRSKRD